MSAIARLFTGILLTTSSRSSGERIRIRSGQSRCQPVGRVRETCLNAGGMNLTDAGAGDGVAVARVGEPVPITKLSGRRRACDAACNPNHTINGDRAKWRGADTSVSTPAIARIDAIKAS